MADARAPRAANSAPCAPSPRCSGRVAPSVNHAVSPCANIAAAPTGTRPSRASRQVQPGRPTSAANHADTRRGIPKPAATMPPKARRLARLRLADLRRVAGGAAIGAGLAVEGHPGAVPR